MAISVVGVGTLAVAGPTTAATPALPAGYAAGDLLVCFSWARATGSATMAPGSGWTQYVFGTSGNFKALVSYRVATGSDSSPTITPSGMSGAQKHMHRVIAFSGVDTTSPWGGSSSWTQNSSAEDIGPVPAPTASAAAGAVLVMGCRLELWTSVATLSGNSLTWSELIEDTDNTVGNPLATVLDFAPWTGGAPTLTSKTFDATGGTNGAGAGWMLLLNAAPLAYSLDATGAGSYSATGQTAGLLVGHRVDASAEAYAQSGQTASLLRGYRVPADASAYGAVGQDVATISGRALLGSSGTYALSGVAAGVLWGHLAGGLAGAYALAGGDASLIYGVPSGSTLTAEEGSFAFTGDDAQLGYHRVLQAGAATYGLTGGSVGLLRGCILGAGTGAYAFVGNDASLAYSTPNRVLSADAGGYLFSGAAASPLYNRRLSADPGAYVSAGNPALFVRHYALVASAGVYNLLGSSAVLNYHLLLTPGSRPTVFVAGREVDRVDAGLQMVAMLKQREYIVGMG